MIIIKAIYTIVSPSMIEEKPVGRRYRNMIDCDIFVRDWNTFKESWKPTDFIKKWADLSSEELVSQINQCFDELLEDSKKLCFLFPDSLRNEYQEEMIKVLQSEKYRQYLDWQHEAMFLGKKKQFLIHKKRCSVVPYLAKYRPPENYKKKFEAIQQISASHQKLIIERNLIISKEAEKQEIQKCTQAIEEFKKQNWNKALKQYSKILLDMIKDFKQQAKKTEIPLVGINTLLLKEIKTLAEKEDIFVSNRFTNISDQEEYKDIVLTKQSREESNPSFDDSFDSSLSDQSSDEQNNNSWNKEEMQKQPPRDIDTFTIESLTADGPQCKINIFSFGTKKPTEKLQITQLFPQETEEQKNFLKELEVTPQNLQYTVTLPYLNTGLTTYSVRAVNEIGKSRAKLVKVWNNANVAKKPYTMLSEDRKIFMMGDNEQGLIPYWGEEENILTKTTEQKWQEMKISCSDFSVSSHAVICNSKGEVAGWGKMYYFSEGEPTNLPDVNPAEEGESEEKIKKKEQKVQGEEGEDKTSGQIIDEEFGFFSPTALRVERPSLLQDGKFIRKVSCGEGYCLMADCFGRAWSFGVNSAGQLGLAHYDAEKDTSEPTLIPFFESEEIFITDVIASSYGASFALTDKGVAYRWGSDQMERTEFPVQNNFKNVVNYQYYGLKTAQPIPLRISKNILDEPIASIHPGFDFVLFLTTQNNLYGCGKCEMLGKGKIQDAHLRPVEYLCNPIEIMKGVKKVSVGKEHCLVLKDNNTLVGWGRSQCFLKNGNKFIDTPQTVIEDFKGEFTCGPNFSVFHRQDKEIEVVGREDIFRKGKYELPCSASKIRAGEGVIMIME